MACSTNKVEKPKLKHPTDRADLLKTAIVAAMCSQKLPQLKKQAGVYLLTRAVAENAPNFLQVKKAMSEGKSIQDAVKAGFPTWSPSQVVKESAYLLIDLAELSSGEKQASPFQFKFASLYEAATSSDERRKPAIKPLDGDVSEFAPTNMPWKKHTQEMEISPASLMSSATLGQS